MSALWALRPWPHPRRWLAGWLLLIATVVVGSLIPSDALPEPSFTGIDKVEHLVAYCSLTGYAVLLFTARRAHWLAALGMVGLGIAMEGAQALLTTSRLADPGDMVANTLGVLLGVLLARQLVSRLPLRLRGGTT